MTGDGTWTRVVVVEMNRNEWAGGEWPTPTLHGGSGQTSSLRCPTNVFLGPTEHGQLPHTLFSKTKQRRKQSVVKDYNPKVIIPHCQRLSELCVFGNLVYSPSSEVSASFYKMRLLSRRASAGSAARLGSVS